MWLLPNIFTALNIISNGAAVSAAWTTPKQQQDLRDQTLRQPNCTCWCEYAEGKLALESPKR